MGTTTPNIGLYKPDLNEAGSSWYDNINANFDKLDARGELNLLDFLPVGFVTDGSVDYSTQLAAMITQAETLGGAVMNLPLGSWRFDSTQYLASTNTNLTYHFRGQGFGTIIKPYGFTSGYLFKLNETAAGTSPIGYPRHPRAIFECLAIDGSNSVLASFLYNRQASFKFANMYMTDLMYGAKNYGYTDNVTLENIYWRMPKTDGWLYWTDGGGDGFKAKQIIVAPDGSGPQNAIYLKRCNGGVLESCIGGKYEFVQCHAIEFIALHNEQHDNNNAITIKNSSIAIRGGHLFNAMGAAVYPVTIDDSNSAPGSQSNVVFDNLSFITAQVDSTTERTADIRLLGVQTASGVPGTTKITLRNCYGLFVNPTYCYYFYPRGIVITSDDATLNTELTTKQGLLSGNVEISLVNEVWKVRPLGQHNGFEFESLGTPNIWYCAETVDKAYGSIQTGTTYYYKAAIISLIGSSIASAEVSAGVTVNNRAIQVAIDNIAPYTMLRLWRGTSTGSYDRYVNIPMSTGRMRSLFDTGTNVSGFVWITTGVPAVPTVNTAYRGSYDGTNKIIWASAAPTDGTWADGDRLYYTNMVAGGYIGEICTTAGTPGTWKTWGAISA